MIKPYILSLYVLFQSCSVGLWAGIQSAGDLVSQTSKVRILHSAGENLSHFDPKPLPCARALSKSNNKYLKTKTIYIKSGQEPIREEHASHPALK